MLQPGKLLAQPKREYEQIDALQVTALHPRNQIVQAATDLAADLMVISTHGYNDWQHLLFGSDAEKIVQHAPCPILVVR